MSRAVDENVGGERVIGINEVTLIGAIRIQRMGALGISLCNRNGSEPEEGKEENEDEVEDLHRDFGD